jgi:hypothetical protein
MSDLKETNLSLDFPLEEIKKDCRKLKNSGRWTEREHLEFVKCVLDSGTLNWKNVIF